MVKQFFIVIFFFSGLISLAQSPYINLEINPTSTEINEPITILLKTNAEGNLEFELPDEFIQSGGMQQGMSSTIKTINNKSIVEKYSYQQIVGHFEKPGNYKIGPARLMTKNGEIKSSELIVKVSKPINMISADPAKNLGKPIFGIIQQSKNEIYEGESVIIECKLYSQVEVIQIDKFKNCEFQGPSESTLLHTSQEVDRVIETVNGRELLTFKAGKTLVFPEKIGEFEIAPFVMNLICADSRSIYPVRTEIKSNISKLKVKALPDSAPPSFIGGVGDFSISAKVSNSKIEQGKVLEYILEISGVGNLHNINTPLLILPKGVVIYGDPLIEQRFTNTSNGVEGSKFITYYLQINKDIDFELSPTEISFFNPVKEKYEVLLSEPVKIKVQANKKGKVTNQELNQTDSLVVEKSFTFPTDFEHDFANLATNRTIVYALIGFPLLFSVIIGSVVKYRDSNSELIGKRQISNSALKIGLSKLDSFNETSYDQLYEVLMVFLASKFRIGQTEITKEFITAELNNGNLSHSNYVQLIDLLSKFDSARFAPISDFSIEQAKDAVRETMFTLNKKLI